MVKLITPIGMLVTVALVTLFSVYALWIAHVDKSWIHALLGVLSLVASYGAATLQSWSQWLVYLLTALFVAAWGYSVYAGAAVGFFDIFYSSRMAALMALGPGIALVLLSCIASWNVFRHFHSVKRSS